jgi:uncharacterized protein (DUF2267 family)
MTEFDELLEASRHYQEWMSALQTRTKLHDLADCHAVFQAVLLHLRTHMPTHDVLAFAGLLPVLPRGVFLGGYQPSHALPAGAPSTFLHDIEGDLPEEIAIPETAVPDVFSVIGQNTAPHVAELMRDKLPAHLRRLWPAQ